MTTASVGLPGSANDDPVLVDRRGAVFSIELHRPETRNPLDNLTVEALTAAVTEASAEPAVRVILLTAAGKAFSADGNLGNVAERLRAQPGIDGVDPIAAGNRRYGTFLELLSATPKVTVAAVKGAGMGGGGSAASTPLSRPSCGAHQPRPQPQRRCCARHSERRLGTARMACESTLIAPRSLLHVRCAARRSRGLPPHGASVRPTGARLATPV